MVALGLSLWANVGWAADPVAIPGSRVALTPPEGFSLAKEFAGLQGNKTSVLVVEVPAAVYDQLAAAISAGAMAKQGVEIASSEDLTGLPFRARIYRGRQAAQGMPAGPEGRAGRIDTADESEPAKIADLESLEFTATGSSNGEPRKVSVEMLFGPAKGHALIGMASPEFYDAALVDFRAAMASFRLKP